eukprot:6189366-Pleurochrysis_carterae.AAC.4
MDVASFMRSASYRQDLCSENFHSIPRSRNRPRQGELAGRLQREQTMSAMVATICLNETVPAAAATVVRMTTHWTGPKDCLRELPKPGRSALAANKKWAINFAVRRTGGRLLLAIIWAASWRAQSQNVNNS